MLGLFQFINYQYLNNFNEAVILSNGNNDEEMLAFIEEQIDIYINWNFLALFFSFAIIAQIILKLVFNLFSKSTISLTDTWTIFDVACAVLNIVAVYMISNVPAETYLPS